MRVLQWLPWVAVALLAVTVAALLVPALLVRLGLREETVRAYHVDETIDVPLSVYEGSPYTLIVFARSSCPVCQRVGPQLRALVESATAAGQVNRRLVAVAGADADEVAFGSALGIAADEIVDGTGLKVRARTVPTVLLVTREGRIAYVVEGEGSGDDYRAGTELMSGIRRESAR